jgi:hypothetical protein
MHRLSNDPKRLSKGGLIFGPVCIQPPYADYDSK